MNLEVAPDTNKRGIYKMKSVVLKTAVLFFIFFLVGNLFAQSEIQTEIDKKNQIKAYVAPGIHLLGGPAEGILTLGYGFDFSRQLSKRLSLSTGIEQTFRLSGHSSDVSFITVPLLLKHHFNNHIYLNHGLLFDLNLYRKYFMSNENGQVMIDTRSYEIKGRFGLGYGLGIGFEHTFDNGIALSLNPFLGYHGLFVGKDYAYLSAGIRIGVGYKF